MNDADPIAAASVDAGALAAIIDTVDAGVLVCDLTGRFVLQNPAMREMLGSMRNVGSIEDMVGRRCFFHADAVTPISMGDSVMLGAADGRSSTDVRVVLRNVEKPEGRHLRITARPLMVGGQRTGAVVVAHDMSREQRADRELSRHKVMLEQEKEALLAELRRSNEELAQFAYVASHDLRAPLRAIDMLAAWIEEDVGPHFTEESAKQMRLLRGRVQRMDTLLRDLLEYSRLGRAEVEIASVDLDHLIAEVIELAGPSPRFQVTRDVAAAPLETAAVRLKQTLLNLLSNAIKHHDRGEGQIRILARDRESFVELEVIDDGPGIPAKFHDKIFEMLQTLKPRDAVDGSGMGLAFVKRLAETAGGTISVESEGRGATFRLRWPRVWLRRNGTPASTTSFEALYQDR